MASARGYIVIHHTGAEEKDTAQIRKNHLRRGWLDIGYNYVIERDGRVVPGRSLEIPGAHTQAAGMNHKSIGVALLGNLGNHPPASLQVDALADLLLELSRRWQIDRDRILLHRQVPGARTACPGRFFPVAEVLERLARSQRVWRVQVGAFASAHRAQELAQRLRQEQQLEAFVVAAEIRS